MKKLLFTLTILAMPILGFCQARIADIWTQPAIFVADEEVTIYFDVTGTSLAGASEDVYLWSWFPSEPDAGNWESSSEFAKLTHVEGDIWQITMVPSEYYGVDASSIVSIYGLLKNKDGSKVTDAFAPDKGNAVNLYSLTDIKTTLTVDYYPKEIPVDRPFSMVFNANNTMSDCDDSGSGNVGKLAGADAVHLHSGINEWQNVVENNPDNFEKTALTHLGDGIWRMDMIPSEYYGSGDTPIKRIDVVLANKEWSLLGLDAGCADFIINQIVVEPDVKPGFQFFPQKVTKNDILTLVATNGDEEVSSMHYKITAGEDVMEGTFDGANPEYRAIINLSGWLKDKEVESINVVVKDNFGITFHESDFTFVKTN
ncbi:hypothetical protein V6R21_03235 [Limibacter armeniacum]|uniref:hypothetical protein n=1 Tax=Limibacter armeniacum TaxID=466084 RepID=UPI002FE519E2